MTKNPAEISGRFPGGLHEEICEGIPGGFTGGCIFQGIQPGRTPGKLPLSEFLKE